MKPLSCLKRFTFISLIFAMVSEFYSRFLRYKNIEKLGSFSIKFYPELLTETEKVLFCSHLYSHLALFDKLVTKI